MKKQNEIDELKSHNLRIKEVMATVGTIPIPKPLPAWRRFLATIGNLALATIAIGITFALSAIIIGSFIAAVWIIVRFLINL